LTEDSLWRKTTFDGGQPLTEDDLWWKTTFNRRRPLMEDYLWQKRTFNGRGPLTEDTFDGRRPLIGCLVYYLKKMFTTPHLDSHSTTDRYRYPTEDPYPKFKLRHIPDTYTQNSYRYRYQIPIPSLRFIPISKIHTNTDLRISFHTDTNTDIWISFHTDTDIRIHTDTRYRYFLLESVSVSGIEHHASCIMNEDDLKNKGDLHIAGRHTALDIFLFAAFLAV